MAKLSKKKARKILNDYVTNITFIGLPIVNEIIYNKGSYNKNGDFIITQLSFKHLIKIAYDLKDKD